VEPGERPRGIPVGGGPAREPFRGGAATAVAVAHLPVHQTERGGERRAQPCGGAISPGGRRHRGNVVAAGSVVNPAARSSEVPACPRPRVRWRDLARERGCDLNYMHEVHVPPATEEVIHCLQRFPTLVQRIALIRKELAPARDVWKPVLVCR